MPTASPINAHPPPKTHHDTRSTFYCVGAVHWMVQTWRVKNKATICSVVNLATHHNSKEETMWKTISPAQQSAIQKGGGRNGDKEEDNKVCWRMMAEEREW